MGSHPSSPLQLSLLMLGPFSFLLLLPWFLFPPSPPPSIFGSLNLTTVRLRGVGDSFRKHSDYESKGIKAHFNMDESGVLSLDRVSTSLLSKPLGPTLCGLPEVSVVIMAIVVSSLPGGVCV